MIQEVSYDKIKKKLEAKNLTIISLFLYKGIKVIFFECQYKINKLSFFVLTDNVLLKAPTNLPLDINIYDIKNKKKIIELDLNGPREFIFLNSLTTTLNCKFAVFYYRKIYTFVNGQLFLYSFNEKSKFKISILSDEEREKKEIKNIKNEIQTLYQDVISQRNNNLLFSGIKLIFKGADGKLLSEEEFMPNLDESSESKTIFDPIYQQPKNLMNNELHHMNQKIEEPIIGSIFQIIDLGVVCSQPEEKIVSQITDYHNQIQEIEKKFLIDSLEEIYKKLDSTKESISNFINSKKEEILSIQQKLNELLIEKNRFTYLIDRVEKSEREQNILQRLNGLINKKKNEINAAKNEIQKFLNDLDIKINYFVVQ